MRGATVDEVKALIPKNWESAPLNKGIGTKYFVPGTNKSDVFMIEHGTTGQQGVHGGDYLRISQNGQPPNRIPLAGNPDLKK